ncbi:MAG: MraZ N-terminal domain-containing protein [bacterium]
MLIGEYIHTIDAKNRISLPVKFRQEMGKKNYHHSGTRPSACSFSQTKSGPRFPSAFPIPIPTFPFSRQTSAASTVSCSAARPKWKWTPSAGS